MKMKLKHFCILKFKRHCMFIMKSAADYDDDGDHDDAFELQ